MIGRITVIVAMAAMCVFAPASAQIFSCKVPVPTLKEQMIQESIDRYLGNCPCPYHRDKRGRQCGKCSAWSREGGASPLCFPEDISADMVREFCEVLKLRGQG